MQQRLKKELLEHHFEEKRHEEPERVKSQKTTFYGKFKKAEPRTGEAIENDKHINK